MLPVTKILEPAPRTRRGTVSEPAAAMIDRRLRWGILLLLLPFATLFPLVSAGALWLLVKTWREA